MIQVPDPLGLQNVVFTDCELAWILHGIPPGDENHRLFENTMHCPGIFLRLDDPNRTINPHEHLAEYERVLEQLERVAPLRFQQMHKGTAYYVMGWLGYHVRDYERGVSHIDAALSEDIHNNHNWNGTPAAAFIFLNSNHPSAPPPAQAIVAQIRGEVDTQIARYVLEPGRGLTTQRLIDQFVRPLALNATHRSIVTALLTFILEGADRMKQMKVRSAWGGTLEPFLTHLFKGGLVYESILKELYEATIRQLKPTAEYWTLTDYLGLQITRADLTIAAKQPLYTDKHRPRTFPDLLAALPGWRGQAPAECAIAIAVATRNTAGHDLAWPAVLDPATYLELYQGLLDAILWVIERKY